MNNNLLYSIVILSILFIVIMILLLVYPNLIDYLIYLASIILVIMSILIYKIPNFKSKCVCGKGEDCTICGSLDSYNFSKNRDIIIRLIAACRIQNNESNITAIFNELNIQNCNEQQDIREMISNLLGNSIIDLNQQFDDYYLMPLDNINLTVNKSLGPDLKNHLNQIYENIDLIDQAMDNQAKINNINNIYDYQLIGIGLRTGGLNNETGRTYGHYSTSVCYQDGWFYVSDMNIEFIANSNDRMGMFTSLYQKLMLTSQDQFNITTLMFSKPGIPKKIGKPFGLYNIGAICYSNSALQLLLTTNILTNKKSKPKELIEFEKLQNNRKQLINAQKQQQADIDRQKINSILLNRYSNLSSNVREAMMEYTLQSVNSAEIDIFLDILYYFYKTYIENEIKLSGNDDVKTIVQMLSNQRSAEISNNNFSNNLEIYNRYKSEIKKLLTATVERMDEILKKKPISDNPMKPYIPKLDKQKSEQVKNNLYALTGKKPKDSEKKQKKQKKGFLNQIFNYITNYASNDDEDKQINNLKTQAEQELSDKMDERIRELKAKKESEEAKRLKDEDLRMEQENDKINKQLNALVATKESTVSQTKGLESSARLPQSPASVVPQPSAPTPPAPAVPQPSAPTPPAPAPPAPAPPALAVPQPSAQVASNLPLISTTTKGSNISSLPVYEIPFKQVQEFWENKSTNKQNKKEKELTPFDKKFGNL